MASFAYYNEFDDFAASWLENLIEAGLIANGHVDRRSIRDVRPRDLDGFTQCHFFAGIGGWSLALRLSGWPDAENVWTGSCPCQPFSIAGKRAGTADERHLWPDFAKLISECGPTTIFGEQVASKDGREWLSGVRADLEAMGYAVGAADLCAPSVGAYHIRQRLYWGASRLAYDDGYGREGLADARLRRQKIYDADGCGDAGGMGYADDARPQGRRERRDRADQRAIGAASLVSGLEHATRDGWDERRAEPGGRGASGGRGESYWHNAEWVECSDGKARPIEPGTFPLANGLSARVGRLRGYGNAIVPQVAAEFVKAWCECAP